MISGDLHSLFYMRIFVHFRQITTFFICDFFATKHKFNQLNFEPISYLFPRSMSLNN